MLVLSRREGERVVIGPDIIVSVERIERTKVRLSIKAPGAMDIIRQEILDRGQWRGRRPKQSPSQ